MNRRQIGALIISLATVAALSAPAAAAIASWQVVKSPDPGKNGPYVARYFREVTAASAAGVWAVGGTSGEAILANWTGTAWRLASLPHPTTYTLRAIDTNGSAVWAVGAASSGSPAVLQLSSGTWQYSEIGGAPASTSPNDLTVISSSDVWVVGYSPSTLAAVALHWNGSTWSSQPPPVPAGASGVQLNRVEQIPGTAKVIAVGYYVKSSNFFPYAVEWTGSAWQVMSTSASQQGEFDGVVVRSVSAPWAVGYTNPSALYPKPLIERWTGTSWQPVKAPSRAYANYLYAVDAKNSSDIWAVGYTNGPSGFATLALHWNGSAWSLGTTANPYPGFDQFFGVSYVPGTSTFWAVGSQGPARPGVLGENTLTEQCTGC